MKATTPFYSDEELAEMGFASVGTGVLLSRRASVYSAGKISLGDHARIDDFCMLSGGAGIELGRYCHLGNATLLYGGGGIVIGDFSGLSSRCAIYSETDDFSGESMTQATIPSEFRPGLQRARVTLEQHVVVGTNSTILPGAHLCEGVAIGAHSLVKNQCEPWSIYGGVPARRLKARSKALLGLTTRFLSETIDS